MNECQDVFDHLNVKSVRLCLIIRMFPQEEQRQSEVSAPRGRKSTESVQKANVSDSMTGLGFGKLVNH